MEVAVYLHTDPDAMAVVKDGKTNVSFNMYRSILGNEVTSGQLDIGEDVHRQFFLDNQLLVYYQYFGKMMENGCRSKPWYRLPSSSHQNDHPFVILSSFHPPLWLNRLYLAKRRGASSHLESATNHHGGAEVTPSLSSTKLEPMSKNHQHAGTSILAEKSWWFTGLILKNI